MIDKEKVIKAWEIFRDSNPYQICDGREFRAIKEPEYCMGQMIEDTIALLKDSGQDEGWLCEKRTSGRQTTDLLCACGDKVYFTTLLFKDGFTANELYCSNCGLSMRSPHHDKDGVWLRKHWEEVVLKAQEPVEPKMMDFVDNGVTWEMYEVPTCGVCGALLGDALFCPMCGKAVKWE